jgi:2-iminobutanoate/2-iminopropanoate deaminase
MKTIINSKHAPKPVGPYSQAVRAGNTLYISGQVAIDPISNTIIKSNIEDETTQIMKNIENILKEAGLMFDNVVRTKIYLTNMKDFSAVNNVYGSYFKSNPPARTTIEVSGLPLGVNVEIDMIAVFNN